MLPHEVISTQAGVNTCTTIAGHFESQQMLLFQKFKLQELNQTFEYLFWSFGFPKGYCIEHSFCCRIKGITYMLTAF